MKFIKLILLQFFGHGPLEQHRHQIWFQKNGGIAF